MVQFWICLFHPSPGLLCDILIVGAGLCEFADISCGCFGSELSARGSRAVQISLTVQWRASCAGLGRCLFMWNMLDDGASPGDGWAGADIGMCVCVHVPPQRDQKITCSEIVQKIPCDWYISNLWGLFRCCRLGNCICYCCLGFS